MEAKKYTFLSVGKANEEITRLNGEVTRLTTELTTANENVTTLTTAGEDLESQLTASQGEMNRLTSELSTASGSVTTLTKENKELKVKAANPSAQVTAAASTQARQIVAAQGAAAIELRTNGAPPAGTEAEKPKTFAERAIAAAHAKAAKRETANA